MNLTLDRRWIALGIFCISFCSGSLFAQKKIKSDREQEVESYAKRKAIGIRSREAYVYRADKSGKLPSEPYRNRHTCYDAEGHPVRDTFFLETGEVLYATSSTYEDNFLTFFTSMYFSGSTNIIKDTVRYVYDDAGNRIQQFSTHSDTSICDTVFFFYQENGLQYKEIRTHHKYSPGADTTLTYYDTAGRMTKWVSRYETISYEYDGEDRIIKEMIEDKQFEEKITRVFKYRKQHLWEWAKRYKEDGSLDENVTFRYYDAEGRKL